MALIFRWDRAKARLNNAKHGVSFEEASSAFGDALSITVPDFEHSDSEKRYILLGETFGHRLVIVSHTERGSGIRIISARLATRRERRAYEQR
jgi:uncharacterized DUF497 family protein